MAPVIVSVSGTRFEFDSDILDSKPHRTLSTICKEAHTKSSPMEVVVGRSPECFSAILNYYHTGELHLPTIVCPGAFKTELEFWGIGSTELARCCFIKFHAFFVEQETFEKFRRESAHAMSSPYKPGASVTSFTSCRNVRTRLWNIVDNKDSSYAAKIYFGVLFLMVMLSIVTLALSTDPYFRRRLNKCEIIEYLHYSGDHQARLVEQAFDHPDCSGDVVWSDHGDVDSHADYYYYDYESDVRNFTWAANDTHWWWWWNNDTGTMYMYDYEDKDQIKKATNAIHKPPPKRLEIPSKTVHLRIFDVLEKVVLVYFTIDFLLRISSSLSILRYFLSVVNVIDFLALVGSYVYVLVVSLKKEQRYLNNWVDVLNYLQIFRALRLFRVVQNVRASRVLGFSIRKNIRDLSVLLMFLVIGVSTFSSIIYIAESRNDVPSITAGWYWSVITMTTVGYGDLVPATTIGRIVAVACALSGVLLLSLTIPIFVNNFLSLYQFSTVDETVQRHQTAQRRSKGAIHAVVPIDSAKNDTTGRNTDKKADIKRTDLNA